MRAESLRLIAEDFNESSVAATPEVPPSFVKRVSKQAKGDQYFQLSILSIREKINKLSSGLRRYDEQLREVVHDLPRQSFQSEAGPSAAIDSSMSFLNDREDSVRLGIEMGRPESSQSNLMTIAIIE